MVVIILLVVLLLVVLRLGDHTIRGVAVDTQHGNIFIYTYIVLNCVLCPLVHKLFTILDLSVYAFADDLTVVSSSWDSLLQAYVVLQSFSAATDMHLNLHKFQIWNKGNPLCSYPVVFDQFEFRFYPFLLGSPIDVGVPCDDSLVKLRDTVVLRAKRIAKLSLPFAVSYRLFTSLVSSCYNHFALSCDIPADHVVSLKHSINSVLVPKRSRWVCRESLYALATPGHLLSPHLFLNYRHVVEYLRFVRCTTTLQRERLAQLWQSTFTVKWGPFFRLRSAARHLGFSFEDPFLFVSQGTAYSVDDPFPLLKHSIRNSYRQFYLSKASERRDDCHGLARPVDVDLTRGLYLRTSNPLHQAILRHVLTGSLDHAYRLYKSNLVSTPICPFCSLHDETAEHIFWFCDRWSSVRNNYPTLMRLFSSTGSQWPNCFLHCGWIETNFPYGFTVQLPGDVSPFSDLG